MFFQDPCHTTFVAETPLMTETLKEYHFTDTQIDTILRLVRNEAFKVRYEYEDAADVEYETFKVRHNCDYTGDVEYNELADLIENQIVNHPTND